MAVDWEAVERAGLLEGADDLEDRRALVQLLLEDGLALDQLAEAHRRNGLIRVGGERHIRPGAGALTLRDLAIRVGADLDVVQRALRLLGAAVPDEDEPWASEDDVELVGTALLVLEEFGDRTGWALLRRYGALVERFTEATSAAVINEKPGISTLATGSEAATAQVWNEIATFVPRLGRLMDLAFRHHIDRVRGYFEQAGVGTTAQASLQLGIGFADLSGYTAASQHLDLRELGGMVSEFEDRAAELISAHGGRVVKFVGDAVLFVCLDADALVEIALGIAAPPTPSAGGLAARAGLAHGWVLARDGDYFGPAVNLASRLADVTPPGRVLLDEAMAEAVDRDRWSLEEQPAATLRGIDDPVRTFLLAFQLQGGS